MMIVLCINCSRVYLTRLCSPIIEAEDLINEVIVYFDTFTYCTVYINNIDAWYAFG